MKTTKRMQKSEKKTFAQACLAKYFTNAVEYGVRLLNFADWLVGNNQPNGWKKREYKPNFLIQNDSRVELRVEHQRSSKMYEQLENVLTIIISRKMQRNESNKRKRGVVVEGNFGKKKKRNRQLSIISKIIFRKKFRHLNSKCSSKYTQKCFSCFYIALVTMALVKSSYEFILNENFNDIADEQCARDIAVAVAVAIAMPMQSTLDFCLGICELHWNCLNNT